MGANRLELVVVAAAAALHRRRPLARRQYLRQQNRRQLVAVLLRVVNRSVVPCWVRQNGHHPIQQHEQMEQQKGPFPLETMN